MTGGVLIHKVLITKHNYMQLKIKNYIIIVLGSFLLAFTLYNIHAQTTITEGGVLGMLLLLEHWFGINPAISALFLDTSLFIVGTYFLGSKFLKYSIVATLSFSLFYTLSSSWGPLLPFITQSQLLSAIVGGVLVGVGVGMIIKLGGACGADDTIVLIVNKLTGIKIARTYLFMDVTILLLSLSYIPIEHIAYSLLTVTVSSKTVDIVKSFKFKEVS